MKVEEPAPPQKPLLPLVLELLTSVDAVAAIGAHLRVSDEASSPDPRVAMRLADVATLLGVSTGVSDGERQAAIGAIRAFLRQALDLVESPNRACAWDYDDPVVLDAQGKGSISVAHAITALAPALGDLAARLSGPGGAFLDLGTGVGWLAITLARAYPHAEIVGVDRFAPALALARINVDQAGLAERVRLTSADVAELATEPRFDGAWVPGPFLSRAAVSGLLPRLRGAVRSGGWVFFGLYGGPPSPLATLLAELRTVRSGGHPWQTDEVARALVDAGFVDVHEPPPTWSAPLRLVVGRAPR